METSLEEEDYSLGDGTELVDTYESNEADVEETYRTIDETEIYCRDSDDIKDILKQPYTIAITKDMFCNKARQNMEQCKYQRSITSGVAMSEL